MVLELPNQFAWQCNAKILFNLIEPETVLIDKILDQKCSDKIVTKIKFLSAGKYNGRQSCYQSRYLIAVFFYSDAYGTNMNVLRNIATYNLNKWHFFWNPQIGWIGFEKTLVGESV